MSSSKSCLLCELCGRSFNKKANIKRHVLNTHLNGNDKSPRRIKSWKCAVCKSVFNTFKEFKDHLPEVHDIELTIQQLEFKNEQDFKEWKKSVEDQDNVAYITHLHSNRKIAYYQCQRSGYFAGNVVRRRKIHRSTSKINAYCPAKIKAVTWKDGSVKVEYCSTHVGHKIEYLPTSPYLRKKLTSSFDIEVINTDEQMEDTSDIEVIQEINTVCKTSEKNKTFTDNVKLYALKKLACDEFNLMLNKVTSVKQVDLIIETNRKLKPRLLNYDRKPKPSIKAKPIEGPGINYLDILSHTPRAIYNQSKDEMDKNSEPQKKYFLILKKIDEPEKAVINTSLKEINKNSSLKNTYTSSNKYLL